MILQGVRCRVLGKGGRADFIDNSDFLPIDFDLFDEPAENAHLGGQIGLMETRLHALGEGPKLALG
jgi:hypothetical protein